MGGGGGVTAVAADKNPNPKAAAVIDRGEGWALHHTPVVCVTGARHTAELTPDPRGDPHTYSLPPLTLADSSLSTA